MKSGIWITGGLAVAAFAAGWGSRSLPFPERLTDSAGQPKSAAGNGAGHGQGAVVPEEREEVAPPSLDELDRLVRLTTDARSIQAITDRLEGVSGAEIERLYIEASRADSGVFPAVVRKLAEAFGRTAPERALDIVSRPSIGIAEKGEIVVAAMEAISSHGKGHAMAVAESLEPHALRLQAQAAVIFSVADQDPAWAISAISDLGEPGFTFQVAAIVQSWAKKDREAAFDFVERMPAGVERTECIRKVAAEFALHGPDLVGEFIGSLTASERKTAIPEMIASIVVTNPSMAIGLVESLPSGISQMGAYQRLASSWFKSDPDATLDWIMNVENPIVAPNLLNSVAHDFCHYDPEGALEVALSGKFGDDAAWLARSAVDAADTADLTALSDRFLAMEGGKVQEQGLDALVRRLARESFEEAAGLVERLPGGVTLDHTLRSLVIGWGREEPEKVLGWLQSHPSDAGNPGLVEALMEGWGQRDPQGAGSHALEIADPEVRKRAISGLVEMWGRTDMEAAFAWSRALAPELGRTSALQAVNAGRDEGVSDAGRLLRDNWEWLEAGNAQEVHAVANSVARRWGEIDPHQAVEWAATLADKDVRQQAIAGALFHWTRRDPNGVSRFLAEHGSAEVRTASTPELVKSILSDDPESALEWAVSMDASGGREALIAEVISDWASRDLASAVAAVDRSPISTGEKAAILEGLQQVHSRSSEPLPN